MRILGAGRLGSGGNLAFNGKLFSTGSDSYLEAVLIGDRFHLDVSAAMRAKLFTLLVVLLLVILRAASEYGMMRAHGPDAQMPIWFIFLKVKLLFWFVMGVVTSMLLAAAWRRRGWSQIALALCVLWAAAIGWSIFRYDQGRRALVDAAAASTSPERLHDLASFDGIEAGYELDNRIASNPNTLPETLRLLHGRPDQVGTELCLARNPNTPDDILRELAARNDDWAKYITDSLKLNPRYDEVFGDRNEGEVEDESSR